MTTRRAMLMMMTSTVAATPLKAQVATPSKQLSDWFDSLIQPDSPPTPCCGLGDAYPVEVLKNGSYGPGGAPWLVKVTDGSAKTFKLPDGRQMGRPPIPTGQIIEVPSSKVVKPDKGNPTNTAWLFGGRQGESRREDGSIEPAHLWPLYCLVPNLPGV